MKKNLSKYILSFLAVAAVISVYAFTNVTEEAPINTKVTAEQGIQFIEQDWSKALKQAKAENKLVFLDIYATWCGPCKMLKKNTFSDAVVAEFFNKTFINVSVDGEKSIGPELARKYSLQGYPTLIVADADGNPVLYTVGYISAEQIMNFAKEAIKRKS